MESVQFDTPELFRVVSRPALEVEEADLVQKHKFGGCLERKCALPHVNDFQRALSLETSTTFGQRSPALNLRVRLKFSCISLDALPNLPALAAGCPP